MSVKKQRPNIITSRIETLFKELDHDLDEVEHTRKVDRKAETKTTDPSDVSVIEKPVSVFPDTDSDFKSDQAIDVDIAPPRSPRRAKPQSRIPKQIKLHEKEVLTTSSQVITPYVSLSIPVRGIETPFKPEPSTQPDQQTYWLDIIDGTPGRIWTDDEKLLVEQVAGELSIALRHAHLIEDLRKSVEHLQAADNLKAQLIEDLIILLRTPVNSIIGISRMIIRNAQGPIYDISKDDFTAINRIGHYILDILNDIKDITINQQNHTEQLAKEQINFVDLINSIMVTAINLASGKSIKLDWQIQTDLPNICVDSSRIRQGLIYTLASAVKYTDGNNIEVIARLDNTTTGDKTIRYQLNFHCLTSSFDELQLCLLPLQEQPKTSTSSIGESKMKLYLARLIFESHGGKLTVESDDGSNCSFICRLPVGVSKA